MSRILGLGIVLFALSQLCDARAGVGGLAELRAAAEKGSPEAQLAYAKALGTGAGSEWRTWAQKAADQGSGEAWYWIGMNSVGDTIPYFEKAAEKGVAEAFPYLLDGLLFRAGARADVVKAKRFGDLARARKISLGAFAEASLRTIDRCFEAGGAEIPEGDRPGAGELSAFRSARTDCLPFQTGVGARQDWGQYRKCLLSQPEVNNNSLAEIYANGWGVPRNARLALALVCHGSGVPAELEAMVETLHASRDQDKLLSEFSFCAHVTSGMSGGECAAREEAVASARRDAEVADLLAKWTEPQKTAFRALRDAGEAYFKVRAVSELDMSGTARGSIAVEEEARLRDELLQAVRAFEVGKLPEFGEFKAADAELNAVYGKLMKGGKRADRGTVVPAGIRKTQRKWLAYRDAWAAFGTARYPATPADGWRAWATRRRTGQLKEQ